MVGGGGGGREGIGGVSLLQKYLFWLVAKTLEREVLRN